jgi:hypothetical protein
MQEEFVDGNFSAGLISVEGGIGQDQACAPHSAECETLASIRSPSGKS